MAASQCRRIQPSVYTEEFAGDRAIRRIRLQEAPVMTRGRHPLRGRILAQPLARLRGTVGMIEPAPGNPLDLVITSPGSLAAVTIQKVECLHVPVTAFEIRYGDLISRVRLLPQGGPVSREVWYYNRYGTWRFFRIDAVGIRELAADGTIISGR